MTSNRRLALLRPAAPRWDLPALLLAANPQAEFAEQHLWLYRVMQWLRQTPPTELAAAPCDTPLPVWRLRTLLDALDQQPERRAAVLALLHGCWNEWDLVTLFADFGFAPSSDFLGELGARLRLRLLPTSPATRNLAELFDVLFESPDDLGWLQALDGATLGRIGALFEQATRPGAAPQATQRPNPLGWRSAFYDSITVLTSQIRAAGLSGLLRPRMSTDALADQPFMRLARVAEQLQQSAEALAVGPDQTGHAGTELHQQAVYLRALLDACVRASESVYQHLEEHGISVGIVFQVDQIRERARRIDMLLSCVLSPTPSRDIAAALTEFVRNADARRGIRPLFSRHYSMLARKVAERSAETGEHYITRNRREYLGMLGSAAGGGAVLAFTTIIKFAVLGLALSPFWAGLGAGLNYALSFLLIYLLHWTVATKQPAMTAPALAAKLGDVSSDTALDGFVDEVAHLIRSQTAGILGNLLVVAPVVLGLQWLAWYALGRPLVSVHDAEYALKSLSLKGPTLWYAVFTGVLLFVSSLIAGWTENWFVLNKIDTAIRWNPRIVARLGAERAARWAAWWRHHISGLAANVSLGLLLGLVPVVAHFFALPLDVRHVTLSTGQIAAALGTLREPALQHPELWWCVAAIPLTGLLNVGVSFVCAFALAMRSRGIRLTERRRVFGAIGRRLRRRPLSFVLPPRSEPTQ
ncbi:site-specific recombinase [Aquabacterium sp.]|uniref:site-specific recombinase n=1 Tax=Aquabacterium sp. TaxID=1872578 RepID=UPI0035B3F553